MTVQNNHIESVPMPHTPDHQRIHTKLVKEVLKAVAKGYNIPCRSRCHISPPHHSGSVWY
ncbi:hypothetical protein DYO40_21850 [Salmonella enterica subsp. enterica serovar Javiana]|nr:hypothetical protein [Salmonella enterica subsp. enterica serovar Javiana]ECV1375374.1 hypothetical protein [Salmonella enterica subsp. enterica serovar Javiana]EEI9041257.1 hypothetical protein [Salmonella enterica subsp. enterica serovar Javiana]